MKHNPLLTEVDLVVLMDFGVEYAAICILVSPGQ